MHKVPMFWRFHWVHHADTEMDLTSEIPRTRRPDGLETAQDAVWKIVTDTLGRETEV